jgi:hypothetical protein
MDPTVHLDGSSLPRSLVLFPISQGGNFTLLDGPPLYNVVQIFLGPILMSRKITRKRI